MTIKITREWVQVVSFRRSRLCWAYSYAINAGRPPAVEIEYGTSLAELRDMLRRRRPGEKIVQAW